jgi:hypothetical protein
MGGGLVEEALGERNGKGEDEDGGEGTEEVNGREEGTAFFVAPAEDEL